MATRYEEMRDWTLAISDTSYWLKDAVERLDRRDPVDAYRDAHALQVLCRIRCEVVAKHNRSLPHPFRDRRW